jgi:glycosyltransferase involved in cell wall biosynthesis
MTPESSAAPLAASPVPSLTAPHLKTAVIIPAFNEAGRITNVLKVVAAAHLVDEIIVVTDGCEDSTADEARGFAARLAHGDPAHGGLVQSGLTLATQKPNAQNPENRNTDNRNSGAHNELSSSVAALYETAKSDTTIETPRRAPGESIPMKVFELEHNIGKGGAMTYGAHRTEADIVFFLDADLIGLETEQVDAMLLPMLHPDPAVRADMTLGLFGGARGGPVGWFMSFLHRRWAAITGQRAIRRDVFLAVPGLTRSRFGVETAITRYVRHAWKLRVVNVSLYGVTHPLKEEKIGIWRGARHRTSMYSEIFAYIIVDKLSHNASARHREDTLQMRERFSNDKS